MEIGSRVGPYEIRQPLGQGGMAQVWKAWHTGLHRFEALKIPMPHLAAASDEAKSHGGGWPGDERAFVERFLHEARIVAGLRHPHIATIYGVSEADSPQPFFAMELVEGGDLAALLRARGRLSLEQALPILEAIAWALDYAHGQGVIHRDIKPANVLLEAEPGGWSPKVVDFGIAQAGRAEAGRAEGDRGTPELPRLSQEGGIVGTPEYMSPEQAGSGEEVGPLSDIYSLGVVAYEMLCGRPPFAAQQDTSPISILAQHLSDLPPRPSAWRSDLPPALDDALAWALAKSPSQRPASGAIFVQALRAAQVLAGDSAAPASTWAQDAALSGLPGTSAVPAAPCVGFTSSAPGPEPAASTYTAPASPTLVQASVQALPSPSAPQSALSSGATGSVQKSVQKKAGRRWLAPAWAAGALCLGALGTALVAARLSRTAPAVPPASTSGPPIASAPGVLPGGAEETAPALVPTALATELPTALATKLPSADAAAGRGEASAPDVASVDDGGRRAEAESTAQRARRVKINVIDDLLLLRKRQERGLLRPSEAASSRRKLLGRLGQALSLCEAALKLDADNETAWEQKAALLFLMGRFEPALAAAMQGLQKFPDNRDLRDARDKARSRLSRSPQGREGTA